MAGVNNTNEHTPLINNRQNVTNSGFDEVYQEFMNGLEEEAPDTTFFDIMMRRPITVLVALTLMALLIIVTSSIKNLDSSEVINNALKVPSIVPLSIELVQIRNKEIEVRADSKLVLDYNQLGNDSILVNMTEKFAHKLGSVNLSFDRPVSIYTNLSEDSEAEWQYLISAHTQNDLEISLINGSVQLISVIAYLSDVGRTDVLSHLVKNSLNHLPISIKATGTAVVKKYGLSIPIPFEFVDFFSLSQQLSDDLAELSRVTVDSGSLHSISVTALANASIGEFPILAQIPALSWKMKIPGCTGPDDKTSIEDVCEGISDPLSINPKDQVIDIFFHAGMNKIPKVLTTACPKSPLLKSPLDTFISKYINGELTTFYAEVIPNDNQPEIISELLCGYNIPYYFHGKDSNEKLIQKVSLEAVRFGNSVGNFLSTQRTTISGRSLLEVVLPRFLQIESKTAIMVTGARGTIQLFDEKNVHFGQVLANDHKKNDGHGNDDDDDQYWLQTISLANRDGYKVICYFDNLPMDVTNTEALAGVSQQILLNGHSLVHYDAIVDVRLETSIGKFITNSVRIKGETEMYA